MIIQNSLSQNKQILFIKRASEAKNLNSVYPNLANIEIVTLEPEPERILKQEDISFKTADDFVKGEQYKNINLYAKELAANWYDFEKLQINLKPLIYEGINLGSLVYREFSYYFAKVMRIALVLKTIFEKDMPEEVILFKERKKIKRIMLSEDENLYVQVTLALANLYKIKVKLIDNLPEEFKKRETLSLKFKLSSRILTMLNKFNGFPEYKNRNAILFFVSWDYIDLVIRQLKARKKYRLLFLHVKSSISGRLIKERIAQVCLDRYIDDKIESGVQDFSNNFKKIWQNLKQNQGFKDLFRFTDIPLWEIVKERFEFLFLKYLPELIIKIELIKKILKMEKIKLVILSNDTGTLYKTIASTARITGVKSLVIQHGTIGYSAGYVPITSDKIAVWGEVHKEKLIKEFGAEKNKIVITGCPRFDKYYQINPYIARKKIYKGLNLDKNKGFFILIGGAKFGWGRFPNMHLFPKEAEDYLRGVMSAMQEFPQKYLIVKNNLGDEKGCILAKQMAKEMNLSNVIVVDNINLYYLLSAADLVIGSWSTVILEAIILGKPIITVNLRNKADVHPFAEKGVALGVYRYEDIPYAMQEILQNSKLREKLLKCRTELIHDYVYGNDGEASKRVAKLIEEMSDQ